VSAKRGGDVRILLGLLLAVFVGIPVAVLAILYFLQERLIFIPSKLPADHRYRFQRKFEERDLEVHGRRVNSLYFPAERAPGTILYFHGNAGDLSGWGMVAGELVERTGWSVWIMDYPGYGKSEGSIRSEQQLHEVAEAFMAAALAERPPNGKIVVAGRSIGSGLATGLATRHPVDGIVLESPYYSMERLAKENFAWVPAALLKYKFPSYLWIQQTDAPVLILHGANDTLIPAIHGKELAALAPASAEFASVAGGGHNDLAMFEDYWSAFSRFLDRITEPR
jgi:uncharacterized protein